MVSRAVALFVLRRFQKFPCIVQNNPLCFSRKPDPSQAAQSKASTAYLHEAKVRLSDIQPSSGV